MPDFSEIPGEAVTAAQEAGNHAYRDGADDATCWRLGLRAALPIVLASRDSESAEAIDRMAAEFRTVLHKDPAYTHCSLAWRLMNDIDNYAASLRGEQA